MTTHGHHYGPIGHNGHPHNDHQKHVVDLFNLVTYTGTHVHGQPRRSVGLHHILLEATEDGRFLQKIFAS